MTKFLILLFVFSSPSMSFAQNEKSVTESVTITTKACDESSAQGTFDAENNHSAGGWWGGGIVSGVALGLIGTGVIWAVSTASNPTPNPAMVPQDVNMVCYMEGYKKTARGKNKVAAGVGGLLGTAAFVIVYLSATSK